MTSRQEHEAWEVLLACQGQLRLAPGGHIVGIDLNVALQVAAARVYDVAVLSELLPLAEAGIAKALISDSHDGIGKPLDFREAVDKPF